MASVDLDPGRIYDGKERVCGVVDVVTPRFRPGSWFLYVHLTGLHAAREPHREVELVRN